MEKQGVREDEKSLEIEKHASVVEPSDPLSKAAEAARACINKKCADHMAECHKHRCQGGEDKKC